jgi:16S rRNA (guanine966-N2)-methyltransferase
MLPGAHVLDLFAGTGVLGIEALSSGARAVEFVEMHSSAAQSLREQLQRLKIADRAQLRQASALDALPQLCGGYDVVFLDPPYALDLWSTCLEQIVTRRLLAPTGLVYVEWPEACSFGVPAALQWRKREQAGSVGFGLLEYGANSR